MAKFPNTVFVKFEDGGTGPDYLCASADIEGMVDVGSKQKVAIYRLESMVECEGVVKTTPARKQSRKR